METKKLLGENHSVRLAACPVCSGALTVSRLECPECEIALEGHFSGSRLGLLPAEHQEFVEVFVACEGSIKAVEEALGISYPTVKKRLDEVIQALGKDALKVARRQNRREEILKKIEEGNLSAKEGARILKEM